MGCVENCTEDDRGTVYNSRFVICALTENHLGEYWTSTGSYDEITMELKNEEDIRDGYYCAAGNGKTDLTALVNLIYLSAGDRYRIEWEERAGYGYADFIFYPKNRIAGMILE